VNIRLLYLIHPRSYTGWNNAPSRCLPSLRPVPLRRRRRFFFLLPSQPEMTAHELETPDRLIRTSDPWVSIFFYWASFLGLARNTHLFFRRDHFFSIIDGRSFLPDIQLFQRQGIPGAFPTQIPLRIPLFVSVLRRLPFPRRYILRLAESLSSHPSFGERFCPPFFLNQFTSSTSISRHRNHPPFPYSFLIGKTCLFFSFFVAKPVLPLSPL